MQLQVAPTTRAVYTSELLYSEQKTSLMACVLGRENETSEQEQENATLGRAHNRNRQSTFISYTISITYSRSLSRIHDHYHVFTITALGAMNAQSSIVYMYTLVIYDVIHTLLIRIFGNWNTAQHHGGLDSNKVCARGHSWTILSHH